jgi:protocatechuate 3,4-dioxygenase beta subunit
VEEPSQCLAAGAHPLLAVRARLRHSAAFDPIYKSVPEGARKRLQAAFDMEATRPEWALAYKFDIVLRGRNATPLEN